ncbi:MAG: NADPH-dependent 2,4-dienoyl-CoA reductase/sulfur reductase-like enzyme [Glaciecola sp.]
MVCCRSLLEESYIMSDLLTFSFDGEPLIARRGQSLAAALSDAGERIFRYTDKGSARGIFCGMGVCQDCLVTVDGVPNQRACMTIVKADAEVRRQEPRPALARSVSIDPGAASLAGEGATEMSAARDLSPDVLIVGAGVGGLNAAIAASRSGASVLVLDERKVAGGQYFKQPAEGLALLDAQQTQGSELLAEARASGAQLLGGVEIWGAFPGPLLYAAGPGGEPLILRPRQLIVATGAYERPRMVPGWTLPGVMTTGAAQTLWRSYRSLPGQRIAVCGSGPLNLQVALELARGGADLRLVAESADSPLRQPFSAAALLLADPRLVLTGLGILAGLHRAKVPIRYRSELLAVAQGPHGSLRATFRCDDKEETLELDVLCMNDGFEPQNEILRLLGAELQYDTRFGHLRCSRNDNMSTSVAGLFAVGDCCGLGGAPAAAAEGQIAGVAAATACGLEAEANLPQARRDLKHARRFQARLWAMHDPTPSALEELPGDTLICRCEEVSLGQFRSTVLGGAAEIGAVKLATRLGMGCCQGRYCAGVAARLLAEAAGEAPGDHSYFAPRVPIKPVSIEVLLATQEALDAKA